MPMENIKRRVQIKQQKDPIADPIFRKLWMITNALDSKTVSGVRRVLIDYTKSLNAKKPGTLQLDLNIILKHVNFENMNLLGQLIGDIQDLEVGEEHTTPKICICISHKYISEILLKKINEWDIYNPPIELYIMFRQPKASYFCGSEYTARLIILKKHHIRWHPFILLNQSHYSLSLLQEGELNLILQHINEYSPVDCTPVLEISLLSSKTMISAFVQPLLALVEKYPGLLETSGSGYCGILNLLNKMILVDSLPNLRTKKTTMTSACCGAVRSSNWLHKFDLSQVRECPYTLIDFRSVSLVQHKCPSCPWIDYCSGCSAAFSRAGKCLLPSYFERIFRSSKYRDLKDKIANNRKNVLILEHDWDYIYDRFQIP